MSVNINFRTAGLIVERPWAVIDIALGRTFACVHLTNGFTDPDIPDLIHNLGNAFKITGVAQVFADTQTEADAVLNGGWIFNFIQVARCRNVSFTWEGRTANEGEVTVIASRPPAMPSNLMVALDAEAPTAPFIGLNAHIGSQRRRQPGQPIELSVQNFMGDHPFLRMRYAAPNSITKTNNVLFEMEDDTEFCTVFVAKEPSGKLHQIAHVRWAVRFVAQITWARKRPTGRLKSRSLDFDTPAQGGPSDPAVQAILNNPVPPFFNDIQNNAINASGGNDLNKMDSAKRSLLLPKDFWVP